MKTDFAISIFNQNVSELAAALGITVQAVYQWGEKVPLLRQYQIRELRPDIFADTKAHAVA